MAHDKEKTEDIVQDLVAVRMKLRRSKALVRNVSYEVSVAILCSRLQYCGHLHSFLSQYSFRGKWPAKRYETVLELQLFV